MDNESPVVDPTAIGAVIVEVFADGKVKVRSNAEDIATVRDTLRLALSQSYSALLFPNRPSKNSSG